MPVYSAEDPQHGEARSQAKGVARQGEIQEGAKRAFLLFLTRETGLEDNNVQKDQGQRQQAQGA